MARDAPTGVPASLLEVAGRVDQRLEVLFAAEQARWQALSGDLEAPIAALASLVLGGGKRLRPAFCYWGFVGAGGDRDDPVVIDAGAAFELLQAFAVVHDDVMDGSSTRRGQRAIHVAFADQHGGDCWRGEPRRFGEGVAILVGDLAHVYSDLLLRDVPRDALDVWHELRIELNVGQYLDILGTARADTDREGARRIARYKSGKYTIERPLHVGAALAGRLGELEKPLSAYGDPLGEAFQLRDDVLGAFGDEALTGKPVGDDLREGKPTALLAVATERASGAQHALLARVGDPSLASGDVAAVQQVLVDTGALDAIEASITSLTDEAIDAIGTTEVTPEAKTALVDLAHFVARRRA
jgi:geranylgeranyl diphosphate synthase type I